MNPITSLFAEWIYAAAVALPQDSTEHIRLMTLHRALVSNEKEVRTVSTKAA